VICCDCTQITDYKIIKNKLQRFLGKDIHCFDDNNKNIIYWFEGDRISEMAIPIEIEETVVIEEKIECLKTNTHLPAQGKRIKIIQNTIIS
jgi:hypothetical protein